MIEEEQREHLAKLNKMEREMEEVISYTVKRQYPENPLFMVEEEQREHLAKLNKMEREMEEVGTGTQYMTY
jgi:hypothetical protein